MKAIRSALIAGALLCSAPTMASASIVGDMDCFGLGGSCPDGTLWLDGLGGVFFTSNQGPGDGPFTDSWDAFVDPTFILASPGAGAAVLTARIAGIADERGPWDVFVNGVKVGAIPLRKTLNDFQEVVTFSFLVPAAQLLASNTVLLQTNDPTVNDGYSIDFVSLTSAGVVEPTSWALMLGGFFGAGALLRRRGARVVAR